MRWHEVVLPLVLLGQAINLRPDYNLAGMLVSRAFDLTSCAISNILSLDHLAILSSGNITICFLPSLSRACQLSYV
ncbi:hypothetical protein V1511DRAFT_492247 [Dipodascopsis uninucleata]